MKVAIQFWFMAPMSSMCVAMLNDYSSGSYKVSANKDRLLLHYTRISINAMYTRYIDTNVTRIKRGNVCWIIHWCWTICGVIGLCLVLLAALFCSVNGKVRVVRSCGWLNSTNEDEGASCFKRSGSQDVYITHCTCNTDGCNGATSVLPTAILITPLLGAVLNYLSTLVTHSHL